MINQKKLEGFDIKEIESSQGSKYISNRHSVQNFFQSCSNLDEFSSKNKANTSRTDEKNSISIHGREADKSKNEENIQVEIIRQDTNPVIKTEIGQDKSSASESNLPTVTSEEKCNRKESLKVPKEPKHQKAKTDRNSESVKQVSISEREIEKYSTKTDKEVEIVECDTVQNRETAMNTQNIPIDDLEIE